MCRTARIGKRATLGDPGYEKRVLAISEGQPRHLHRAEGSSMPADPREIDSSIPFVLVVSRMTNAFFSICHVQTRKFPVTWNWCLWTRPALRFISHQPSATPFRDNGCDEARASSRPLRATGNPKRSILRFIKVAPQLRISRQLEVSLER
jgi:hypothetical protein